MSDSAPPAGSFYWRDFFLSTAGWELDEVGAYMRLLCAQWEQGSLPPDPRSLRIIVSAIDESQWSRIWSRLEPKVKLGSDGKRRNARLEKVRQSSLIYRQQRSDAGKAGAAMTHGPPGSASGSSNGSAGGTSSGASSGLPSPFPSPDSVSASEKGTEGAQARQCARDEHFRAWWSAYPKRTGKGGARSSWNRMDRAGKLPSIDEMLAKLAEQKRSDQWRSDGGRYVPNPQTYLNQERWTDDVSTYPKANDTEAIPKPRPVQFDEKGNPVSVRRVVRRGD